MFWPFKKYDVEMSPEIRGVIKLDGVPQAGLTVYRELFYEGYKGGKEISDSTITNKQGEFQFSEFVTRSRYPGDIFGQSLPIIQEIYTKRGENEVHLWRAAKSTDVVPLLSELLINLDCDLNSEERSYDLKDLKTGKSIHVPLSSICRWQGIDGHTQEELINLANESISGE